MRKKMFAVALAAVTAVGLAACGGGDKPSTDTSDTGSADTAAPAETDAEAPAGDAVTLNMLAASYSDNTKGLWEGYISAFEAENPGVKINLEMQSWENINEVIKTKVQGNQAPDILSIDAFSNYVDEGLLYSADEILSPDTIADFQPNFVENATMNGKQYGFPLIASARALFVNNAIADEAGVDPESIKTWDDLEKAAKAITDLNKGYYGYGSPLGSEEAQAELGIWLMSNGGSYGDAETLTIDDPKNVEAAEFLAKLIDAGLTEPDAGAVQRTPMFNNVFMQGKIGLAVGLPPLVGMIKEQAPDLDLSIVPFPTNNLSEPVTLGVADHLMAFKNDDSKGKQIGAFLDFFYKADNYVKFIDTEGFLPTTKSGAEGTTKTEFKPFNDLLPYAKFYPSTNTAWGSTQGLIQQQIGTIAQGKKPADVLKSIQSSSDTGL
jgi:multiple sugar transport system substrate-binding protein